MYTIKQAAARSGVSIPVLRAWERRYGVVSPTRTESGYRLYDDAAIDRVRAMQRLVAAGWTASQAAREITEHGVPPPAAPEPAETDGAGVPSPEAFVVAAAGLDERGVETWLDDAFAASSFERALEDRVMPALRALGDGWADGRVSVAGEHAASHAVLRRLSGAFEAAARPDAAAPVMVGLPPGTRHELGVLAFATAARRRGLPVVYLGADVPIASWAESAARSLARAVVIGVPTTADVPATRDLVAALGGLDGPPLIAIGGSAAPDVDAPGPILRLPPRIAEATAELERALTRRER